MQTTAAVIPSPTMAVTTDRLSCPAFTELSLLGRADFIKHATAQTFLLCSTFWEVNVKQNFYLFSWGTKPFHKSIFFTFSMCFSKYVDCHRLLLQVTFSPPLFRTIYPSSPTIFYPKILAIQKKSLFRKYGEVFAICFVHYAVCI